MQVLPHSCVARLSGGRPQSVVGFHRVQRCSPCTVGLGRSLRTTSKTEPLKVLSLPAFIAEPLRGLPAFVQANAALCAGILAAAVILVWVASSFNKGSRKYEGNVGAEYDTWTKDGVLEAYWGEHIHLGYYAPEERGSGDKAWLWKKDFKKAKYDFIDEMLKWSGAKDPKRVLDVGCGFGGTSRRLAQKFPNADVQGITLSNEQVRRGTELCKERGINNATFQVMDALTMTWPDNSFDLVWACESGEHMPDKKKYVEEMVRVLKPGGTLVIACWCQREEGDKPFTQQDRDALQFLYDEWAHPFFISKEEFVRLMEGTGALESARAEDWKDETLPSWRQSIWVGVVNPWPVILKFNPAIWWSVIREIVCIERMHRAFQSGLMEYGMMVATKPAAVAQDSVRAPPVFTSAGDMDFSRPSGMANRASVSANSADDVPEVVELPSRPSGGSLRGSTVQPDRSGDAQGEVPVRPSGGGGRMAVPLGVDAAEILERPERPSGGGSRQVMTEDPGTLDLPAVPGRPNGCSR